ncbi:LacI family DNA-binding transcriptional regulator [Microbacterium sp.]|uniref:LacI family DNA-binding transcriptional regulator n=1 Tax=Microbacterium sp. TaxID=51671 RepID=UPI00333F47EE
MTRATTVYDVAAAAGVSTATVSRYFRSPDKLSPAALTAVQAAVERLGYLPSGMARGLAERRTGAVGLYSFSGHEADELLMPEAGDADTVTVVRDDAGATRPRLFPLFADEVLRGVELECTLRRLPLVVGWQPREEGGIALDEIARRVDGLVVLPSTLPDAQLKQLARAKAIVVVSQPAPGGVDVGAVLVNNEGGMRALAGHLADVHDVREFWFAGPQEGFEHEARRRGFDEALRERGLVEVPPTIVETGSRVDARAAVGRALARCRPPRAIVCASDQTGLGVMEALADAGYRVPDDVIVTGFDGIDAGRFMLPGLTTVRQPMELLGRVALQLLAERLDDAGAPTRTVTLPVEVVLRGSCGCGVSPAPR